MRQLSPARAAMSKDGAPGLRHRITRRSPVEPRTARGGPRIGRGIGRRISRRNGDPSSSVEARAEVSLTYVIVCQCKVVSDADLRLAVEAGARSLASACRATGASSDCGHCVFQVRAVVKDLVEAHTAYTADTLAQLAEVLHEAEEPARRRTA